MPKILNASEPRRGETENTLKTILTVLRNIIISESENEKEIGEFQEKFDLFLYDIFDVNFLRTRRLEYLINILTVLVTVPVETGIRSGRVIKLYEKLNIVNTVTFLIFQIRQIKFSKNLILNFLGYIKNDSEYNYYALLFYRVNPQLITEILKLDPVDTTPKELYFGIVTGYFSYRERFSACYDRLINMLDPYIQKSDDTAIVENAETTHERPLSYTPVSVLMLLAKDGFICKETFKMLTQNMQ